VGLVLRQEAAALSIVIHMRSPVPKGSHVRRSCCWSF